MVKYIWHSNLYEILLWALRMPQAIRFTIFHMTDVTEEGFSLHITFWAPVQMLRAKNESLHRSSCLPRLQCSIIAVNHWARLHMEEAKQLNK